MLRPLRSLLVPLAAVVLVLGGGAALYARKGTGDTPEGGAPGDSARGPAVETSASEGFATDVAIPVEGGTAKRDVLVLAVSAAGQAEAWKKNVLVAQVGGRIGSLPVRESDAVGQGQTLVALDPAEYGLAVEEAEAAVRDARAKYQEQILFDDRIADAGVRADRERIARGRSGLDAAEVRLRKARLDLARTRLAAPFAGRIATLKAVPGQWVRQGDELMTLVDLDPIKVEVQVLESEIGWLSPGRSATVTFAAFAGETFTGKVETINPVVESGTRTARVTVLIPNPQGRILPGMYARVSLEARRFDDRILVPRAAILERDRRTMLFVFDPEGQGSDRGLAKWRYVTTGMQNDSLVEIVPNDDTEMVEPGETVLTDGHYTLIHDARVRVVENVKQAGGRPQ
jgi:membrane fusion protein (multidrug efflux system)